MRTQHLPLLAAWADGGGGETAGPGLFRSIGEALGAPGLAALQALLAARAAQALTAGVSYLRAELGAGGEGFGL